MIIKSQEEKFFKFLENRRSTLLNKNKELLNKGKLADNRCNCLIIKELAIHINRFRLMQKGKL